MKRNLPFKQHLKQSAVRSCKAWCFGAILLLCSHTYVAAQPLQTITNYPKLSSTSSIYSGLTFEVVTSQYLQLHRFEIALGVTGVQPVDIYYRRGGVEHTPGVAPVIDSAHGWVFAGTYNVNSDPPYSPGVSEIVNLYLVPGTYGFYANAKNSGVGLVYKSGTTDTAQTGGVSLRTTGWGGDVPILGPNNSNRAFIGGIQYRALSHQPGDMAVLDINPSAALCATTSTISAQVANFGASQISSATLNWSVNGVTQPSVAYSGLLDTIGGQGSLVQDIVLGNYTISNSQQYEVAVWSSLPNGGFDPVALNDTATTSFRTAMDAGTYTINPSGTGSNNFTSFSAVSKALSGGICGPVTFNVAPGVYADHLFLDHVEGASAINTITFDGGDTSFVELAYSSNDDTANVLVQGTDYVTFKNMTISNSSSSDAWGIMLQENADYITIDRCKFVLPVASTTDLIAVIATANMGGEINGENANYTTISNCTFIGGECGVNLEGPGSRPYALGHKIINNVFRFQYDHAIDLDQVSGVEILNNDVDSMTSSGADAFTFDEIDDFIISGNRIISTDWAFDLNDANDGFVPAKRSLISNNMLISQTDNAFDLDDIAYVDVYHNTALGNPAMEINDPVVIDIRNNIFSSSGVAFGTDALLASTDTVDYNLYDGSFELDGTNLDDLTEWQRLEPQHNVKSLQGLPMFLGPRDLHLNGPMANGNAYLGVGVTVDIDGDVRSTTSLDMGADEISTFVDTCLQAGGFRLEARTASSVTFEMDRAGANYAVEWGPCGFVQGAGTVVTGAAPLIISGLSPNACYEFYTRRICSSSSNYNDTIGPYTVYTECTGPLAGGTYTVDPGLPLSASNYHSLSVVAQTLRNCGISGPITVNVAAGTYTDPLYFPEIQGSSANNTITFNGADSSNTVLFYDGISSPIQEATLKIDGCDWLNLHNFKISNGSTASSNQEMIVVGNSSDHLTITNCAITQPAGGSAVSLMFSDNPLSVSSASNFGDNITLTNNTFKNGYRGVYSYGSGNTNGDDSIFLDDNLRIAYNVFNGMNYAIELRNLAGFEIEHNQFSNIVGRGILCFLIKGFKIANNTVFSDNDDALVLYGSILDQQRPNLVVNNFVHSTTKKGLRLSDCTFLNVYHNTANGFYCDGYDLDVRNNIFTSNGAHVVEFSNTVDRLHMDHNNYFASGSAILFKDDQGSTYTSLADWQTAYPIYDQQSVSGDPMFLGPSNFHASSYLVNNTGDSLGILIDLDGDVRSTHYPDLGADEFSLPCLSVTTNGTASSITPNGAQISWTRFFAQGTSTGTTNNIEYGLAGFSLGSGAELKAVSSPYLLSSLTSGTMYEFYVQDSCGTEGTSGWVGPFSFTTAGTAPCAPSVALGADQQTSVGARLYWTPGDAAQWNIEYGPSGFTPDSGVYVFNNQDSSLILSNLMGNTCYDFYVQDSCGVGYVSTWSGPHTFCTLACAPAINLGADQIGPAGARVFWTAGGASTWSVEYGVAGFAQGNGTVLNNVQNDTLNLSGLLGNTCYDFYVQDSCGAGSVSSWSGPYNFCTLSCSVPSNLGADQFTTVGARLYWTTGGAGRWNVQYGPTGFGLGGGIYLNNSNDTLLLNTLQVNTCYDFYVRDSCGLGSTSSWVGPYTFCTLGCSANAGSDSTIDACLTDPTFDLIPYLGMADTGGVWVDLDGANFLTGSLVAFGTGSNPGTYRAAYVVAEPGCPNDTAIITLRVDATPNAGADVSLMVCDTTVLDLDTVLIGQDVGGVWLDVNSSGALSGSVVDFNGIPANRIYTYQYMLLSASCGNDTATVSVYVDSCGIGLNEYSIRGLAVYPNPSAGTLHLEFTVTAGEAHLHITDLSGKLVYSNTLENLNGQYKGSISISGLAAGTYLLTIESDGVQEVVRVMKE